MFGCCYLITYLECLYKSKYSVIKLYWCKNGKSRHRGYNLGHIILAVRRVFFFPETLSATQTEANKLTELWPNATFSRKPSLWDWNSKCFVTDNKSWHCLISILQILIHCGVPLRCFLLWLLFAYFSRYSTHQFCHGEREGEREIDANGNYGGGKIWWGIKWAVVIIL